MLGQQESYLWKNSPIRSQASHRAIDVPLDLSKGSRVFQDRQERSDGRSAGTNTPGGIAIALLHERQL
jgi:hypothetical protein